MIQIQRILYPTDFSDPSQHALAYATDFCRRFGAKLFVLHVVDEAFQYWMASGPNSLPIGPTADDLANVARNRMKELAGAFGDLSKDVTTEVLVGRPFAEIVRYAADKKIDLIVIGTHGRGGLSHALMGSVAEKVVRKSPCPVLTIRHPSHDAGTT